MAIDDGSAKKRAVKLEGGPHDGETIEVERAAFHVQVGGCRYVRVSDEAFCYRSPEKREPPPTRALLNIGNSMTDTLTRILARLDDDETDPGAKHDEIHKV